MPGEEGGIGSVGVTVVPDAREFWRRFEAQTSGEATRVGEREGADWRRGFESTAGRADIRVRADTSQARAELSALNRDASRSSGGLLKTLLPLAPALVPLAGAAGVAGAALGAMGVTGAIAVKSIEAEMKKGTKAGTDYAGLVASLKAEYASMQHTVAVGALPGIDKGVAKLRADMPQVNALLSESSKTLGDVAQHIVGGLVGGLNNFAPGLIDAEHGVDRLAARFESWATGPGGAKFAQTLTEDFHQVGPVVNDVAVGIGHLLAAANGPGLGILKVIDDLSVALDHIPTGVLSALIAGWVTFQGVVKVTAGIDAATAALGRLTAAEEAAGAAARGGAAGAARGGLAAGLSRTAGIAAGLYFGSQLASSTTAGWRTSSNAGQFFAGNLGQTLGNAFSGNFGSIGSDITANSRARDSFNYMQNRAKLYTTGPNSRAGIFQGNKAGYYVTAAGDLRKGALNAIYDPSAHGGVVAGHGSVDPALAKKLGLSASQATQAVSKLTNAEVEAAQAGRVTAAAQQSLGQAFQTTAIAAQQQNLSQAAQSYSDLSTNLGKTVTSQQKWLDQGGKTVITLKGMKIGENTFAAALAETNGDYPKAIGLIEGRVAALGKSKAALAQSQADEARLSDAVTAAGTKYGITADQVTMYATAVGISSQAVADGAISTQQFVSAIGEASRAIDQGNTAVTGWVAAVQQFQQGTDTAASRAQLMAAAMVALNGPMLAYANTGAQAAQANQQLVTDFRAMNKSAINLKTGMLDYHNAAAAPVLNDLQQLQTAAANFAAATYQNEVSTKGATQASKDAAAVYYNDTHNALVAEHTQLGLTTTQAKNLANVYFHWPKDARTQVEALGAQGTNEILIAIGDMLAKLTGQTWEFGVKADTSQATAALVGLQNKLAGLGAHVSIDNERRVLGSATGGYITGPGSGTSDSIPAWLSNGEFVINAAQTSKHRTLLEAINQGTRGFESGGFVGVTTGSSSKKSSGSSSHKAAVARPAFDSTALSNFLQQIGITTSAFTDAKNQLISALRTSKVTNARINVVAAQANRLIRDSQLIAYEQNRLAAAQQNLANLKQQAAQESSTVRSAVLGGFNITSAGVSQYQDQPGVTISSIIGAAKASADQAAAFRGQLAKLKAAGLNQALYQQLAEAGPGQDQAQLTALSGASRAQIAQLNAQYGRLSSYAGGTGSDVSNAMYSAGERAAQGLVNGLLHQKTALVNAMHQLAAEMENTIRRDLKIHSPSRKFAEHGRNVVDGLVNGIVEKLPDARSAAGQLAASIDLPGAGRGRGADAGPLVAVYPTPGMSEVAIGTAAARRIVHLGVT